MNDDIKNSDSNLGYNFSLGYKISEAVEVLSAEADSNKYIDALNRRFMTSVLIEMVKNEEATEEIRDQALEVIVHSISNMEDRMLADDLYLQLQRADIISTDAETKQHDWNFAIQKIIPETTFERMTARNMLLGAFIVTSKDLTPKTKEIAQQYKDKIQAEQPESPTTDYDIYRYENYQKLTSSLNSILAYK